MQCCLGMAPFTGVEGYRVGLSAVIAKDRLEESDATTMIVTQTEKDLSVKQFQQFIGILKRHPQQYERLKRQIGQLTEFLGRIEKSI